MSKPFDVTVEPLNGSQKRKRQRISKTYECGACVVSFTRQRNLKYHMKRFPPEGTNNGGNMVADHETEVLASGADLDDAPSDDGVDVLADLDGDQVGASECEGTSESEGTSEGEETGECEETTEALGGPETAYDVYMSRFQVIAQGHMDGLDIENAADIDEEMVDDNDPFYPFFDMQTLVLHAFMFGDDDMVSRRKMKNILYLITLMVKLSKKVEADGKTFKLPALDALYNYGNRVKNRIPEVTGSSSGTDSIQKSPFHMILPSTHLKDLVCNPVQSPLISALPYYTPHQLMSLQQGQKWRKERLFQQPVLSNNSVDYWTGDIILVDNKGSPQFFLLESYFTKSGETFGRCYGVVLLMNKTVRNCLVETWSCDILVSSFRQVADVSGLNESHCKSLYPGSTGLGKLVESHRQLLFGTNQMKRPMMNEDGKFSGQYYKVKIVPLILFTDDTSGNSSKQYNKYDNWSMVCGALSFEARNNRENTLSLDRRN
ncbi:unnamed protein product [Absidia cylindrospora]